ncbi:MAG: hypothetical protein ACXVXE_04365 [Nocardioidaceae bacterium]
MLLAVLAATGCQASSRSTPRAQEAPACGLVSAVKVVGLMGRGLRARHTGDGAALRRDGTPYTCVTRGRRTVRALTIRVLRHPAPLRLDSRPCRTGWVYAGTPDAYAPACQEAVGSGGRTRLLVRHGAYLVELTVDRADRNWAGDAEVTLGMAAGVARGLGLGS